jgi:hypothetical protein
LLISTALFESLVDDKYQVKETNERVARIAKIVITTINSTNVNQVFVLCIFINFLQKMTGLYNISFYSFFMIKQ